MRAKILIVEDEIKIAKNIQSIIEEFGHEVVDCVTNYEDAIKSFYLNLPNLLFMDINLGKRKKDGIEIVKTIQETTNTLVVYFSEFTDEKTIKRAIQTNPINYLLKPHKKEDIKLNILLGLQKLKQISFINKEGMIYLGNGYFYEQENSKLYYKDTLIRLSPQEKILLNLLIESNGDIVSNDTIQLKVWDIKDVSESSVRTLVYRLRGKLNHQLIQTVPCYGVKLPPYHDI
jgi:DNA-binding response OmpR family regulator